MVVELNIPEVLFEFVDLSAGGGCQGCEGPRDDPVVMVGGVVKCSKVW